MVRKTNLKLALKKKSEKSWLILDSSNLHIFSMTPYSVLVGIKVFKNDVINNFLIDDQLPKMHCFISRSLQSFRKNNFFHKMAEFCQLQRILEWKLCILESWSLGSKLFITSFLTNLISIIKLYDQLYLDCGRTYHHRKIWEHVKMGSILGRYIIPMLLTNIGTFFQKRWIVSMKMNALFQTNVAAKG